MAAFVLSRCGFALLFRLSPGRPLPYPRVPCHLGAWELADRAEDARLRAAAEIAERRLLNAARVLGAAWQAEFRGERRDANLLGHAATRPARA